MTSLGERSDSQMIERGIEATTSAVTAAQPSYGASLLSRPAGTAAAPVQSAPSGDRFVPQHSAPASSHGGMLQHLDEAIALNTSRRDYYASRTGGRSYLLSTTLISLEKMSRSAAAVFDREAKPFQRAGIPIVSADFVPISGLPLASKPPQFQNVADKAHVRALDRQLADYRKAMPKIRTEQDLRQVAALSSRMLETIERTEQSAGSHFAMTKHVVESIGMAALNGLRWAAQSGGKTVSLTAKLVESQELALHSSVWIDKQAQRCHVQGVGIIVNDVPHIPFKAQWEAANPVKR